jgi:hypothetical protein
MLFSYSESIVSQNLDRIKAIRDTLPKYLNLYDQARDKDNTREMRINGEGFYNWIRTKAPGVGKGNVSNTGRGNSSVMNNWDEACFIPNVKAQYESSVFAYKTVAQIAKKNGSYYHRIMSSSCGSLDNSEGEWCFNFVQASCEFTEKMYDYDRDLVDEMIIKNSTNSFLHI